MNKLIVNADDFGYSEEVNDAIVYGILNGLIDRTTIMVNMPFCEDAVNKAIKYGFENKVGLHLNVVEGKPLTEPIKKTILCNAEGLFDDETMKKKSNRVFLGKKERDAIGIEIEAQIEKFLSFHIGQKHIDSHRHAHVAPSVFPIIVRKYNKYHFESIRLARNIPQDEIRGVKRILKVIINRIVLHMCVVNKNILFFGSMKDVEKEIKCHRTYGDIELMVHPVMRDGIFCDAIEEESVEEWLNRNENCICNITL